MFRLFQMKRTQLPRPYIGLLLGVLGALHASHSSAEEAIEAILTQADGSVQVLTDGGYKTRSPIALLKEQATIRVPSHGSIGIVCSTGHWIFGNADNLQADWHVTRLNCEQGEFEGIDLFEKYRNYRGIDEGGWRRPANGEWAVVVLARKLEGVQVLEALGGVTRLGCLEWAEVTFLVARAHRKLANDSEVCRHIALFDSIDAWKFSLWSDEMANMAFQLSCGTKFEPAANPYPRQECG